MATGAAKPENDLNARSLTAIYARAAARYHKTFPEKLANLFITRGGDQIYVAPEAAAFLTENIAGVRDMVAQKAAFMREQGWGAMATEFSAVAEDGAETRISHLMLPEGGAAGFVSRAHPAEMNEAGVFDHEMGHFIVEGGYGEDINLAECAADAFAALRHIQRFGGETDMAAHAARVRADNIILYPAQTHYTSAVFEKIAALQDAGEINIAALPLKETAALAAKIARAAALDGAALERVRAAYAPVRAALAEEPPDPVRAVKELVRVLHENSSDADICRAGRLFLDSPKIKSFIADAGLADDPAFRIGARAAEEGRAAKAKLPEGLTP